MKKRISALFILTFFLACISAYGQQKGKATEILDKTAAAYAQGKGIAITFSGTQRGTLQLQGERFHLTCGGVESWFDGKTQWSYVEANDEVTISSPTPDELQEVNPYAIFGSYKTAYKYGYRGTIILQGKSVHQVVLNPRKESSVKVITLFITPQYVPQRIALLMQNGERQIIDITSYQTDKSYTAATFRFDKKQHPQAEVIDLR